MEFALIVAVWRVIKRRELMFEPHLRRQKHHNWAVLCWVMLRLFLQGFVSEQCDKEVPTTKCLLFCFSSTVLPHIFKSTLHLDLSFAMYVLLLILKQIILLCLLFFSNFFFESRKAH